MYLICIGLAFLFCNLIQIFKQNELCSGQVWSKTCVQNGLILKRESDNSAFLSLPLDISLLSMLKSLKQDPD